METLEAVRISLTQNPLHLGPEAEARRRLFRGVHLEILRDRIDALAQHLKQCGVRRLGRQYPTRQQHDAIASRHRARTYSASTSDTTTGFRCCVSWTGVLTDSTSPRTLLIASSRLAGSP